MVNLRALPALAAAAVLLTASGGYPPDASGPGVATEEYVWDLPPGFPEPRVPADNPMTPAKVELGRKLFRSRSFPLLHLRLRLRRH